MEEVTRKTVLAAKYKKAMELLRTRTEGMSRDGVLEYLHNLMLDSGAPGIESQVAAELICNRESLMSIREYDEGFFRRAPFVILDAQND